MPNITTLVMIVRGIKKEKNIYILIVTEEKVDLKKYSKKFLVQKIIFLTDSLEK